MDENVGSRVKIVNGVRRTENEERGSRGNVREGEEEDRFAKRRSVFTPSKARRPMLRTVRWPKSCPRMSRGL